MFFCQISSEVFPFKLIQQVLMLYLNTVFIHLPEILNVKCNKQKSLYFLYDFRKNAVVSVFFNQNLSYYFSSAANPTFSAQFYCLMQPLKICKYCLKVKCQQAANEIQTKKTVCCCDDPLAGFLSSGFLHLLLCYHQVINLNLKMICK